MTTHQTPSPYSAINFADKFALLHDQWAQKVVAEMNDYQFKLARLEGELMIYFRDGEVTVRAGEMYVVKKGIEHKPHAPEEIKLLLIEPRGVLNTGDETNERTAVNDAWI